MYATSIICFTQVQVQVVLALMHYLFHVEVGHSATHTHLLLNRVHQFHASFFTSHVVIYKLLNRRIMDPSGRAQLLL